MLDSMLMLVMLALAQQLPKIAADQFWPVSIAGWLSLFGLFLGVLGGIWTYMKALVHLNGLGERVTELSNANIALTKLVQSLERQVERVIEQNVMMVERVGEASREAESCREGVVDLRAEIVGHLSEHTHDVNQQMGAVRERVRALEVRADMGRSSRS